jgi:hypothetical protein
MGPFQLEYISSRITLPVRSGMLIVDGEGDVFPLLVQKDVVVVQGRVILF